MNIFYIILKHVVWRFRIYTVIRQFEDAHFLGLIFETSKEI